MAPQNAKLEAICKVMFELAEGVLRSPDDVNQHHGAADGKQRLQDGTDVPDGKWSQQLPKVAQKILNRVRKATCQSSLSLVTELD